MYVADTGNHRIRKITATGQVTTLAGSGTSGFADGTGAAAQFDRPGGVAVDGAGNVYVADTFNNRIRKITATGEVTTLLTNVTGIVPVLAPGGVAVDGAGNVYVADTGSHRIRKITATGQVSILAGSGTGDFGNHDGTGVDAQFHSPSGVAVDGAGNVYVADTNNSWIRKITATGVVTRFAISPAAPVGVAVDEYGDVYVVVAVDNYSLPDHHHRIFKITAAGVLIHDEPLMTILAGPAANFVGPASGFADGAGVNARFRFPSGVAVDGFGNVYVADTDNHSIRKIR